MKLLLFFNQFHDRHNPVLFWKVTLWVLLSKTRNYSKYYLKQLKKKLKKLENTVKVEVFSHWKDFLFLTGYRFQILDW